MHDSDGTHFHKHFVKSVVENSIFLCSQFVHTPRSLNYLLNYVIACVCLHILMKTKMFQNTIDKYITNETAYVR